MILEYTKQQIEKRNIVKTHKLHICQKEKINKSIFLVNTFMFAAIESAQN